MAGRASRSSGWIIGAAASGAALLVLSSCGKQVPNQAPPRALDTIAAKPQASLIAVPVIADLTRLAATLEREVPRTLWSIDKPDQVCVPSDKVKVLFVELKTPTLKCRIVGEVTRGPLAISGSGKTLLVTMPIHAVVRARDIGGMLKQETATADAKVTARITLDIAPDWNARAKVDIAYDWTKEPSIDFLGQRIVLTNKADDKLAGVVTRLERTLPGEIAKLDLRRQVEENWRAAYTSLQLNRANPPVWMRITPQELQYGGYSIAGRTLSLKLGMKALTETFVGERPQDPTPRPLPPLRPLQADAGKLLFYIPVIASYRELEPVVMKALVKRSARPFVVPGIGNVRAEFHKATVYGTEGGKIAVGVEFTARDEGDTLGPSRGTVWLTGKPVNAANSRKVAFGEFAVSGTTDSTGTDLLLKLVNAPGLSSTISESLAQNFEKDFGDLLGKVSRAIDETREGDLLIRARIDDVRTGQLKAAGQGLYLPVWGTGTASIALAPR